jgi:hypothetical protein
MSTLYTGWCLRQFSKRRGVNTLSLQQPECCARGWVRLIDDRGVRSEHHPRAVYERRGFQREMLLIESLVCGFWLAKANILMLLRARQLASQDATCRKDESRTDPYSAGLLWMLRRGCHMVPGEDSKLRNKSLNMLVYRQRYCQGR